MSPLPVARKESASLPASRLAMMLPSDVETRIPPAILLTSMPPEPVSHCTPAAAPTLTGPAILRTVTMPLAESTTISPPPFPAGTAPPPPPRAPPTPPRPRHIADRDDAVGGIDDDLAAAVSGGNRAPGFNNVNTAAAGFGAHRAADIRGGDAAAHGFQYGSSAHRADLDLPRAARTAQPAAHCPDANIAAAGDQAAIAADTVRGDFPGAGIDLQRPFDAAGIHRAIGSGDHHLLQARGFHGDGGDHRAAGRGDLHPLASRGDTHVVAPHDDARFGLRARADAQVDRVRDVVGRTGLHVDRPVGIDPQTAACRHGAGELAHEAIALVRQAGWLRHGHERQQEEDQVCPKMYRSTHSCP